MLVSQDSALLTSGHWQLTSNLSQFEPTTSEVEGEHTIKPPCFTQNGSERN